MVLCHMHCMCPAAWGHRGPLKPSRCCFLCSMKERGKPGCSHIAAGLIFLSIRLNIIVCVRRGGSGAMTESGEGRVAAAMKEEDFVKNKELGASYSHPRAGGESDEPKTYKFVDNFCFKKAGVRTTGGGVWHSRSWNCSADGCLSSSC